MKSIDEKCGDNHDEEEEVVKRTVKIIQQWGFLRLVNAQHATTSDVLGDHAISCGNQGGRIARHDSLRDALHVVTQTACFGATREDRSLLQDTEARLADVPILYT